MTQRLVYVAHALVGVHHPVFNHLEALSNDRQKPYLQQLSGMVDFAPGVLSSLRKALAFLRSVLRQLAARGVLQRVWSFILRSLQFCTGLPYRPVVSAEKDQRRDGGCGMTPRLTPVNGGNVPTENPSSQLLTSIHTSLDPSSAADTSQGASPLATEPSPQNSLQPNSLQDPSGPQEQAPSRADNSRESFPLTPMSVCQNSPPSMHLVEAPDSTQQRVSQPRRGEPVPLPSHRESLDHASIRPSSPNLLALAKPVVPGQLQRYNRKFEIQPTHYTDTIEAYKFDFNDPQPYQWRPIIHPEGALCFQFDGDTEDRRVHARSVTGSE
ncbi:hypothetical protein PAXINDRAFT_12590 [Paxillus involutus ATCC 200175]|uniref:Uncharacterized protein n=1 Tax=Paxillus involutus ATCC 200175 TaxID=664439 RepID=A0A0C9TW40_PAXIN|nr:hypothetical protein PAXINDRAFT_12590 [Paxillus involutus ATCC 200175]